MSSPPPRVLAAARGIRGCERRARHSCGGRRQTPAVVQTPAPPPPPPPHARTHARAAGAGDERPLAPLALAAGSPAASVACRGTSCYGERFCLRATPARPAPECVRQGLLRRSSLLPARTRASASASASASAGVVIGASPPASAVGRRSMRGRAGRQHRGARGPGSGRLGWAGLARRALKQAGRARGGPSQRARAGLSRMQAGRAGPGRRR